MTRNTTVPSEPSALPEGYTVSGWSPGLEENWARLMYSVAQTDSLQEAREVFASEFLQHRELLPEQCLFVLDPCGEVVSAASLWFGSHFGDKHPRIHWVATDTAHEGRGLARALLTRLLELHDKRGGGFIYLTTQTWSCAAIGLYKKLGFTAYTGEKPAKWRDPDYLSRNAEAWRQIDEKLREYSELGCPEISVASAFVRNADELARIICASWRAAYVGIIPAGQLKKLTDETVRAGQIAAWMQKGGACYYIACRRGVPCAACCTGMARDAEKTGEIVALYVLPEHWGDGTGGILLESALRELKRLGSTSAQLWVFKANARARRFYEKHGFSADGAEKDSGIAGQPEVRYVRTDI